MRIIDRVAELLRKKKDVVFFDCGGDASRLSVSVLKKQYHTQPTALCDKDVSYQGKSIGGIAIQSPEKVAMCYPDAYWLITNFLDTMSGVFFLEQMGISKERIINYRPYEKRFGCRYLESYLHIMPEYMDYCCNGFGKQKSPHVDYSHDVAESLVQMNTLRKNLCAALNNGTACDGCPYVKYAEFTKSDGIRLINFDGGGICNFKCIYCSAQAQHCPDLKKDRDFSEVFSALKEQGYLSEDVHVQFNSGEIGVNPQRSIMFSSIKGITVSVLTNASVYCEEIAEKMSRGEAIINVSLDAGTRAMFHRVKGVDAWELVCNNLRQYAEILKDNIVLKYIFIPGINDNFEEMDGFVQVCEEVAGCVQISYDLNCPEKIDDTTRSAFRYLKQELDKRNILWYRNGSISLLEKGEYS